MTLKYNWQHWRSLHHSRHLHEFHFKNWQHWMLHHLRHLHRPAGSNLKNFIKKTGNTGCYTIFAIFIDQPAQSSKISLKKTGNTGCYTIFAIFIDQPTQISKISFLKLATLDVTPSSPSSSTNRLKSQKNFIEKTGNTGGCYTIFAIDQPAQSSKISLKKSGNTDGCFAQSAGGLQRPTRYTHTHTWCVCVCV